MSGGFLDSMVKTLKANRALRGKRNRTRELLDEYNQKHTSGKRKINLSEINERLQYRRVKERAELKVYKYIFLVTGGILFLILILVSGLKV
ncbi:MAG: hypothetical protein OEY34_05205 [Cyclobacteriaceae bacterium]|nr:hypothetical protein [Cyclobacteriaceae bacterium]